MNNEKDHNASAGAGQTPPTPATNTPAQEPTATFSVQMTPPDSEGQAAPENAVQYTAVPETAVPSAQETPVQEPPTQPAEEPTTQPAEEPTTQPAEEPTAQPAAEPTAQPAEEPTTQPAAEPTTQPAAEPPTQPAEEPPTQPAEEPTTQPAAESPTQPAEEPTTQPAAEPPTQPAAEPPTRPAPANRRQHYFTNLPTIGLEAEPLTAPWETDNPPEDTPSDGEEDTDETSVRSDRITTIIAVVSAAIIAIAALAFVAHLLLSNIDSGKQAVPARKAPSDSATISTLPTAAVETKMGDPNKMVVMPNLYGLQESAAYKRLNDAEVRYRVVRVNDEEVPFNYIVSQNPAPGQEFSSTEEAVIYLSKGKENERIESTKRAPVVRPTTATTAPAATSATGTAAATSSDYILPDSASKQLTRSDIAGLDRVTLNLALNEIYARHGRKFTDTAISDYFNAKSWYHPTIAANDFDEALLNQFELANLKLISSYQLEKGYR